MFEDKDVIRILSIDGGGIRGIIPVTVLAEIEKRCGKQIYELFDFIAGTSTGGLITLFLNKKNPAPAEALAKMYIHHGKDIFPPKTAEEFSLKNLFGTKGNPAGPKYKSGLINLVLRYILKDKTYEEMIKPCLITSYETENNKPVFFTSYTDRYKKVLMRDIARATSAVPTYFAPLKIKHKGTFIDGGIHSTNPAMCAYIEVLKLMRREGLENKKIIMVSLGTGDCKLPYEYQEMRSWSPLQWIQGPLLPYFFGGNASTVEYQLKQFLPEDCYYRFQPKLPKELEPMDNAEEENVLALQHKAMDMIDTDWKEDLEKLCSLLAPEYILR